MCLLRLWAVWLVQGDWVNGKRQGFGIYRSVEGKEYVGK